MSPRAAQGQATGATGPGHTAKTWKPGQCRHSNRTEGPGWSANARGLSRPATRCPSWTGVSGFLCVWSFQVNFVYRARVQHPRALLTRTWREALQEVCKVAWIWDSDLTVSEKVKTLHPQHTASPAAIRKLRQVTNLS
nr:uncharacterized protein LOC107976709 isoform X1 [Pan troglodytes]